jgi:hypothetical protein
MKFELELELNLNNSKAKIQNNYYSDTRGVTGSRAEEGFKDHQARDGSNTSLVSFRPHTQLEEEDSVNEAAEDERRGDGEGER